MIHSDERLSVNAPSVVWEDFGDEVVIVNLESGRYFSCRGCAVPIWRRLSAGLTPGEIEAAITAIYDVDAATALQAIRGFATEAVTRGLLVSTPEVQPTLPVDPPPAERQSFVEPLLETFSDMQDILLLDPIHESDPSGWPAAQSDLQPADVQSAQA